LAGREHRESKEGFFYRKDHWLCNRAQLLTYMKLANINIGLLINFNVKKLKDGIERFKF